MISMENWVTDEMEAGDIKKNTIRVNRADLETTNGSIMSVKNTAQGLHYAAHSSGTVQKLFPVKPDSYLNRLFGLRMVAVKQDKERI